MENRELLFSVTKKDFEITWYCSPGPGGQKKNKTMNACRMKHLESGVVVTAQECRERNRNLQAAFRRLIEHPKFKMWMNRKTNECLKGKTIEKLVDESMQSKNLKFEIRDNEGKWKEISESDLRNLEKKENED